VSGEDGFRRWCASKGGSIVPYGTTGIRCSCPTSSGSTGSGYTIYDAAVDDFLRWLFSPNSTQAAQRKAALKQQLEAERQAAIARKQAEQVARLDAILLRLSSSLKGFNTSNDLQLKLSPTGPIKFTEYMATPATQTTSARLELKTGSEATRSLETPKPNASSAGVINPTPPTPLQAPTFDASQLSPEAKELAEMLSKLTPEQQQKLLATMKSIASAEQAATATTNATPANPEQKDPPLTLKLSEAQKSADDLKTAAADPNSSPEELKKQAADQFKQLQQTTLGAAPPAKSDPLSSENKGNSTAGGSTRSNETGSTSSNPNASIPSSANRLGAVNRLTRDLDDATVDLKGLNLNESKYFYTLQTRVFAPMYDGVHPLSSVPAVPLTTNSRTTFVGGTTWTYGFKWPSADAKCRGGCESAVRAQLEKQLELSCKTNDPEHVKQCVARGLPFTPENYDMVVSMGSYHSTVADLALRVVFDNATLGEFTRQHKEIFASLENRQFDTLDCHSNGAMICLAALRSKKTTAKVVRLFGPQITPEAASIWRDLANDPLNPIKIEIYINNGDPVPGAAWRLPKVEPIGGEWPVFAWLPNAQAFKDGIPVVVSNVLMDVYAQRMDKELAAYGFTVQRNPCSSWLFSLDCHSMLVYEKHVR
jgi:hypothetical protein